MNSLESETVFRHVESIRIFRTFLNYRTALASSEECLKEFFEEPKKQPAKTLPD